MLVTILLVLFVQVGLAQMIMKGSVLEVHASEIICTENTPVKWAIWGKQRIFNFKATQDTAAFIFTHNYLKVWKIAKPTKRDLEYTSKINDLYPSQTWYYMTDYLGDRYLIRILTDKTGFIIFITNYSASFPHYVLSFVPSFKLCDL